MIGSIKPSVNTVRQSVKGYFRVNIKRLQCSEGDL